MSKILRRCAGLALLAAAGLGLASALPGPRTQTAAAPPAPPFPAAGLRVHVDPATGRMVPRPAAAQATPALLPAAQPGLVEEPGTTAAGGFKVTSRGQFQSAVVLRVGPDGKPIMTCVEGATAQPQNR